HRSCRVLFLIPRPPPSSTLFPYTTLFRSTLLIYFHPLADAIHRFDGLQRCCLHLILPAVFEGLQVELHDKAVAFFVLYLFIEPRSEEHTSELQSRENLVCRLLLEKKKPKH